MYTQIISNIYLPGSVRPGLTMPTHQYLFTQLGSPRSVLTFHPSASLPGFTIDLLLKFKRPQSPVGTLSCVIREEPLQTSTSCGSLSLRSLPLSVWWKLKKGPWPQVRGLGILLALQPEFPEALPWPGVCCPSPTSSLWRESQLFVPQKQTLCNPHLSTCPYFLCSPTFPPALLDALFATTLR